MRDLSKANLIKKMTENEEIPLKIIHMNVNEDDSVVVAFEKILDESKRIDFLVNNAGFGLFGALEDLPIGDIKKQSETNFFGATRTIQQVLPIMRVQKTGTIVNISSLSGHVGFPTQSVYVSTKFALEGLSESLAYEVEQDGIKVVLVEPGVINTKFVENIMIPLILNRFRHPYWQIQIVRHRQRSNSERNYQVCGCSQTFSISLLSRYEKSTNPSSKLQK